MKLRSALLSLMVSNAALAHNGEIHDQDGVERPTASAYTHAPIGVMADHMHKKGEWMWSLRSMEMVMHTNYDGSDKINDADITGNMMNPGPFMVAPTNMHMTMHMLGAMYAPSDDLTLMTMLSFVETRMDHRTRMGGRFNTEAEGLGDASIGALYRLPSWGGGAWHASLNVVLPTGSISERDDTPAMANAKLPYPMQPGSGSVSLQPGVTWQQWSGDWHMGAQLSATLRLDENSEEYTLGDRYQWTGWLSKQWIPEISTSVRLNAQQWDGVDGANPQLNPNMVQTANPDLLGGKRVDLLLGTNFYFSSTDAPGHRAALEVGAPVYQDLDGPQLGTDLTITAGWQYALPR